MNKTESNKHENKKRKENIEWIVKPKATFLQLLRKEKTLGKSKQEI